MQALSYRQVTEKVLNGLAMPRWSLYYLYLYLSLIGMAVGAGCWAYQIYSGMGASGLKHPVMWGTYLINFVFWIEIGHAGSLMSALLYLTRASWRSPIARTAEAMTIFSVSVAALFPFIHLGRTWIFYWLIPYPNQRNLWPNYQSPLIFDFWAASGYLTISLLFWYTGLLPDLAAARDHTSGWRRNFYTVLSLGWNLTQRKWRPFKHAYVFFAALTVSFVVCVASIVSWDYALTIIPGYHSTIWGPYFLVGAVHSGLCMLLTLIIPLRRIYRLEEIITVRVLENIAKVIVVMALLLIYDYLVEFFMAFYSGNETERTTFILRVAGPYVIIFWATVITALVLPLAFMFKGIRTSPSRLFILSIIINIGMWMERFIIIIGPPSHDFIPYAWGTYAPSLTEWGILIGSFSLFAFMFLLYAKLIPTVSIAEMKESSLAPPSRAHMGET